MVIKKTNNCFPFNLVLHCNRFDTIPYILARFYLLATDHGKPSLNSTPVLVTVNIRDVNDNQPVFDRSYYSVSVSESDGQGTDIVQVGGYANQVFVAMKVNCTSFDPPRL